MFDFDQVDISAILAKPDDNGPFPAVVLLHTCGGMMPHVSQDWPNYLSGQGYVTLTPDSFGSRSFDKCEAGYTVEQLRRAQKEMARDAYGALQYLANLPYVDNTKIGVMGFSFGANVINGMLMSPKIRRAAQFTLGQNFRAGIVFYGRCKRLKTVETTPFPVIQIIGDKDLHAPECAELNHRSIKVHLIPGAYHHFDGNFNTGKSDLAGNYSVYDEKARDESRKITVKFLASEFSKSGASNIGPGGGGMASGAGMPTADRVMKMMDKNGDRQISKTEFRGPPQRFGMLDSNGDGNISKSELESGFARRRARQQTPRPPRVVTARARPESARLLSKAEIRKTIIGNTLSFIAPSNGKKLLVYFSKDGEVQLKIAGGGKIIRKNWFFNKKSMLCRTFGRQNKNHCTKIKATGSADQVTLFNDKISYRAKLAKGRQLQR